MALNQVPKSTLRKAVHVIAQPTAHIINLTETLKLGSLTMLDHNKNEKQN